MGHYQTVYLSSMSLDCQREERKGLGRRNIEETMAEKFPKSMNNINPLIQAQRTPRRLNTKKTSPKKIKGKLLKTKAKEQSLEADGGEGVLHTAAWGAVTADLSPATASSKAEMLQEMKTPSEMKAKQRHFWRDRGEKDSPS